MISCNSEFHESFFDLLENLSMYSDCSKIDVIKISSHFIYTLKRLTFHNCDQINSLEISAQDFSLRVWLIFMYSYDSV